MSYREESAHPSPFQDADERNLGSPQFNGLLWSSNSVSVDDNSDIQSVSPVSLNDGPGAYSSDAYEKEQSIEPSGLVGALVGEDAGQVVVKDEVAAVKDEVAIATDEVALFKDKVYQGELVSSGTKEVEFSELSARAALLLSTLCILVLDTLEALLSLIKWPVVVYLAWMAINVFISTKTLGYTGLQPGVVMCQLRTFPPWSVWPCKTHHSFSSAIVDFPRLSEAEGDALQTLLEESIGLAEVGWDLSRSDLAVGDLIRYVHTSRLVSKSPLLDALGELQKQVQASVVTLRTLRAAIVGTVQRTMAINEYTLQVLKLLHPNWTFVFFPALEIRAAAIVHHHFDHSIEALVNGTAQVLTQCTLSIDGLESMANTLSVIQDITSREHTLLVAEREEVQSSLWTLLGGNKERLRGLSQQLVLMGAISNHRMKALRHARRTMEGVLNIQDDVSHIRNDVAIIDRPTHRLPAKWMELQLFSITAAMARIAERMDEARKRHQQLERGIRLKWSSGVEQIPT